MSDPANGGACFMGTTYNVSGIELYIGHYWDAEQKQLITFLQLWGPNWKSLVADRAYPISVKVDGIRDNGWANWAGKGVALDDGSVGLRLETNNFDVLTGIAGGIGVQFAYQDQTLLKGSLAGSARAVLEVLKCDEAHLPATEKAKAAAAADPFK
jgi:hypothetical protein